MKKISCFLLAIFLVNAFVCGAVFAESDFYRSCDFEDVMTGQSPDYGFASIGGVVEGGPGDNGKYAKNNFGTSNIYAFIFTTEKNGDKYNNKMLEDGTFYIKYRIKSAGLGADSGAYLGGIRSFNSSGASVRNRTVQILKKGSELWYNLYSNYKSPVNYIAKYRENEWVEIGFAIELGNKNAGYAARVYFNGTYIGSAKSDKGGYHAIDSICINPYGVSPDAYFAIDDVVCAYGDDVSDEEDFFRTSFFLLSSEPADGEENAMPADKIKLNFSAEAESFEGAFLVDGEEPKSVEKSEEFPNEIVLTLNKGLAQGSEHSVEIIPEMLIPKNAKPYSGRTMIKFKTGFFEKVDAQYSFYTETDGNKNPLTSARVGEVKIDVSFIPIVGDFEASVIIMKAKEAKNAFRITETSTSAVSLTVGEKYRETFSVSLSEGEFIKILLWDKDENSLINIANTGELK